MPRARLYALGFALTLAATAANPARAEVAATWDQERVTALAEDLAAKSSKVYDAVYRIQLGSTVGSGQAWDYQRLRDRVRLTKNEARQLARQLANGKGHDETIHTYERLTLLSRDVNEIANRMFLDEATLGTVAAAGDALRQITPYYDPEAMKRPLARRTYVRNVRSNSARPLESDPPS